MGRRIKISSGILNLRLHPHAPNPYMAYINDMYRLRKPIKIHGDRYGVISLLNRTKSENNIVTGLITTFVRLDLDGAWFDITKLSAATDEQISELNIPDNVFPNAASFYFHFDTEKHKIYIQLYSQGKTFTINSAYKFFSLLSRDLSLTTKYGEATISVVQSKVGLAKLFALPKIKEIKIVILKPNADIFSENFEEEIEAHLINSHSKKLSLIYEAEANSSLVPTEPIRTISMTALENGHVEVRGRDDSGAVKRSTDEFPRILQDTYDPDQIGEQEAFNRLLPSPTLNQ